MENLVFSICKIINFLYLDILNLLQYLIVKINWRLINKYFSIFLKTYEIINRFLHFTVTE